LKAPGGTLGIAVTNSGKCPHFRLAVLERLRSGEGAAQRGRTPNRPSGVFKPGARRVAADRFLRRFPLAA